MNTGAWELLDPEVRLALIEIIDAAKGPGLVARVAAQGSVTTEEIERELVDRNGMHERWLRQQQVRS
ncbi:MAG TPA: hypothetical protein VM537_27110 [Anaerolineae bacterium]|nr:hypothetical protein [Anaerolineae bacterium]